MTLRSAAASAVALLVLGLPCLATSESDAVAMLQHSVTNDLADADVSEETGKAAAELYADDNGDQDQDEDDRDRTAASYIVNFRLSSEHEDQRLTFQPGESAELSVLKCQPGGIWVECEISGRGDVPGTYNVRILNNPTEHQEQRNTPAELLRGSGDLAVGQRSTVKVNKCLGGGEWVPVTVAGPGEEPDTFTVEVADGADSRQEIPNVPISALRRA